MSLQDRLKASALNFDDAKKDVPVIAKNLANKEFKQKSEVSLETKKNDLKKDIDASLKGQDEISKLKKMLEEKDQAYRKLASQKNLPVTYFDDFKARTFRITDEQYKVLNELVALVPKTGRKMERVTINTFLRGVLQNFIERSDQVDTSTLSGEIDVYNQVSKVFK
jgi:hypothetical protein